MELSESGCWDCPGPLHVHLISMGVGLALLVLLALCARLPRPVARVAQPLLFAVGLLWYVSCTQSILQYGIAWPGLAGNRVYLGSPEDALYPVPADALLVVGWCSFSLLTAVLLRRLVGGRGA